MTLHITSDTHWGHKNILTFESCNKFRSDLYQTVEEMDRDLIKKWNSSVDPRDTVYHLGDVCLAYGKKMRPLLESVLRQLNGKIILLKGNHDNKTTETVFKEFGHEVLDYKRLDLPDRRTIIMSHYPMYVWDKHHHGSVMLHGHCVDHETEVLTNFGWKYRKDLSEKDLVLSYNKNNDTTCFKAIDSIIDVNYTGYVYNLKGRSFDQRITEGHTVVGYTSSGNYFETPVESLHTQFKMIHSGVNNSKGLGWGKNLTALYVAIAADGEIKEKTNLVRIRVYKERKIKYYKRLLTSLQIPFREILYDQVSNGVSLNFTLPKCLLGFRIKGMDPRLVDVSSEEFEGLYEALGQSDGTAYENYTIYTTAKKTEVDLIQAVCCRNGYRATFCFRKHGLSKNVTYKLSISKRPRSTVVMGRVASKEWGENEKFWCIKTEMGNFFIRRNGKISLTGNCHGSLTGQKGKILDVGWDCWGRVLTLDEAYHLANEADKHHTDHHQ